MTSSFVPRPDPAAAIVGGLLGGLVVAGSVLAFVSVREPRVEREDQSVAELRIAVAELKAQTAELRAQLAAQALAEATRPVFAPLPPAPPAPPEPPVFAGAERAVDCTEEHRCTLDRKYMEEMLANPASVTAQLRIMPSVRDGQVRGLKLYGIRPGSLAKLLGFRNGDLVVSINGAPVTGGEPPFGVHRRLRSVDTLAVEIERKGERLLKTCDLR
jgi:membrane-associated protease RseP (regulator of RpoE activity)